VHRSKKQTIFAMMFLAFSLLKNVIFTLKKQL